MQAKMLENKVAIVSGGSNSWAYTRLGHISNKSTGEMAELLSNGDVTISIGKR